MASNGGALKRGNENTAGEIDAKKFKQESDSVSTLPYRDIPYEEQLKKKQEEVKLTFGAFGNQFKKRYPQYAQWFDQVFLGSRFKIDNIHRSPKTLAYRNKCELTVGYNPDQGKLSAGPRIANAEDGKVQVGPCDKDTLIHLPPSMVEIAQDFSNFLEKWNYLEEKCPWYNLFIRVTKSGDHMLIVMLRDEGLEVTKERKNELVKYYTEDYQLSHKIKSIYIQPREENCEKKSFELDFLHAHGADYIVEKLLDLQLIVTPSIFFRINTYAAETLYQKTLDCADLKRRFTVVIDLWCGCGELSLLAAKRAQHVIAIDPSKWNIRKAQFMAKYNKIFNIDFIIAKPEDGLKTIWNKLPTAAEIVIIADPPTLCKMMSLGDIVNDMPNLKRFIYLYSSHKLHLVKNLLSLTEASLLPTRVVPVDVSPHNVRIELIASLTRVNPNDPPPVPSAPVPLEAAVPSAEFIEQIERRAFAMGMAKAMEAAGPAVPPVPGRPAIPSILDDGFGGGYGRSLPEPEFGTRRGFGGPSRGAGRFGGYEDEYGGGFDEPSARFAGDAGRGGKNMRGVANNVAYKFGAAGTPEKYGSKLALGYRGGRGGGFGAKTSGGYGAEPGFGAAKKFGGFGATNDYDDYSGYEDYGAGGYGAGANGFGAAKRGRGSVGADGFGRSGFTVDTPYDDTPAFGSGYGGRASGGFGERAGAGGFGARGGFGGARGSFSERGARGGFAAARGFGERGARGFGGRGARGFGGRGAR